MTITIGEAIIDFDDLSGFSTAEGQSQLIGDNIIYYWIDPDTEGGRFAIYDIEGTQIVAPTSVDDSVIGTDMGAQFIIYGVSTNADGGFTIHFESGGTFGSLPPHFVRDFSADGTPLGASTEVPELASILFIPNNAVPLALSNGNLAIAQDNGLSIYDGDGVLVGGAAGGNTIQNTFNGFDLVEVDGQIMMVYATGTLNFSTFQYEYDITAQFFGLDGSPQSAVFTVVEDVASPSANYFADNRVAATVLANGNIAVAYGDTAATGDSDGGISAIILGPDGSIVVPEFTVNVSNTGSRQYYPEIFALEDGTFLVAYKTDDQTDGSSNFIAYQLINADGTLAGPSVVMPQDSFELVPVDALNTIIFPNGQGVVISESGLGRLIEIDVGTPTGPTDQTLPGTGDADTIVGGDGDDTITGRGGSDELDGGAGNDSIVGGIGFDTMNGGAGNDTLQGQDGYDVLNGGAGDDSLSGNNGFDLLDGGAGNDTVFGGLGLDTMLGGDGEDLLFGQAGFDLLEGGAGNDNLNGNAGADTLNGDGGDDVLNGGINNDLLNGGEGNDTLNGNNGSDSLLGGTGEDRLEGNAGSDTLDGGTGDDILRGGIGADTFVFNVGSGDDRIADFQNNIDQFILDSDLLTEAMPVADDILGYASLNLDGFVVLTFGADSLTFTGVTNVAALVDDLVFS